MSFKRIQKAIFFAFAVLSACMCIASLTVWIRSYYSYDVVSTVSDSQLIRFDLGTARGELMLETNQVLDRRVKWTSAYSGYSKHALPAVAFEEGWPALQRHWSFGRVAYFESNRKVLSVSVKTRAVVIPLWITTLTFALFAAPSIALLRRRKWSGPGFPAQVANNPDHDSPATLAPPPTQS